MALANVSNKGGEKMAFKIHAVRPKNRYYCFIKALCSECGNPHMYPKYGTPETRFDGRRFKYVCYKD